MPIYNIKVKWSKQEFPHIKVDTDEPPLVFKAQIYALTGVHPERQKVMCKGGILKDDEWNVQLKDGTPVLLMGSKDELAVAPTKPVKFIEDMDEAESAVAQNLPAGLKNLGNTCYLNATIQCLKAVPELCQALEKFQSEGSTLSISQRTVTSSIKNVFAEMDKGAAVTPLGMLRALHTSFPQFMEVGPNGVYKQQDANECWSELLKMIQSSLFPLPVPDTENAANQQQKSFVDQFFGGALDVAMKCEEAPDETVALSKDTFLQLSCFISPEVKYMLSGLKSKMTEKLVKRSSSLDRDANYIKTSLISRLPAYLTVQMVRFQFKSKEGINAKVLKDIKFPLEFDAYELCTSTLREKLTPMRARFEEAEKLEKANPKSQDVQTADSNGEKKKIEYEKFWFDDDYGSNNSGYYTLQAVLTHRGRTSSSGHYVAWVRKDNDVWFKFDDDDVSAVHSDDILKLSGGGDWHCAYVLLYAPRRLPKTA